MSGKKCLTVNNTPVYYYDNELESEQVLLFLHGWGGNCDSLKAVYRFFCSDFRVISVDLPGFGESPVPPEMWGSVEYADLINQLMLQLNLKRVVLVGHSFGGKIGIVLSAQYPDKVKRLFLIDSSGLRSRRGVLWYLRVWSYKIMKHVILSLLKKPELLEKMRSRSGSVDYRNAGPMREILVRTVNEDFSSLMPAIQCPVFLFWGEKDDATPLWMARKMNQLMPDSALYVVKNGSHYSFLEDQSVSAILRSFIMV